MNIPDDGLVTPTVGAWAERKYRLFHNCVKIISTSMKNKWDSRVYIDLFTGSGKAHIRDSLRIVLTSPLLALDIPDKFDKYIFCEKDSDNISALEHRVRNIHPDVDAIFICGDVNQIVDRILHYIPKPNRTFKVLSFCFADPFRANDLYFNTISDISSIYVDFLVLLPIHIDINRNKNVYMRPENKNIDNFVGSSEWKKEWEKRRIESVIFEDFFSEYYQNRMKSIGYDYYEYSETIRNDRNNSPLYKLVFFSRHPIGKHLFKEAKKYSSDQTELPF